MKDYNDDVAKKRQSSWARKDYATNPKKYKEKQWRYFGVVTEGRPFTLADYDRAYQIQQGCCKICGVHQSDLKCALSVDHDHNTGIFRGLLCRPCNSVLGLLKERIELLDAAKKYLEESYER